MSVASPNEWMQQITEDNMLMAANSLHITNGIFTAAAGGTTAPEAAETAADGATERSIAGGRRDPPKPLRCPRCDSSNTKFCYYNNYSLSQPRHYCKSCKRYWTLGGTLRNVPVGGGCRKNKRAKKLRSSSSSAVSAAKGPSDPSPAPPLSSHRNATPIPSATSSSGLGQPFYSHSTDVIQQAFPNCISYDLQSQFSTLGLFPSNADEDHLRRLKSDLADHHHHPPQVAPAAAATTSFNPLLHDYSLLGEPNPTASLHASSLKQQQQHPRPARNPDQLSLYAALLADAAGGASALFNGVKLEGGSEGLARGGSANRFDCQWQIPLCENAMDGTNVVAGESSLYWNAAASPAFGGGALL